MRERLKLNQRGTTLAEIMVALLILTIVVGLAGSMIISSSSFYRKSSESNLDKLAADGLYQIVSDKLIYATAISVNQPLTDAQIMQVRDGRLYYNNVDLFTDEAYHGRTVQLEVSHKERSMELLVILLDYQGNEVYRVGASMKLLNLEVQQTSVTGENHVVNPTIYFISPQS